MIDVWIYRNIISLNYINIFIFPAIDTTNASSYREVDLLSNSATLEFLGQFGRIPTNSLCSGHSIPMFIKKTILKLCVHLDIAWNLRKKIFETLQRLILIVSLPPCHAKKLEVLKRRTWWTPPASERHISDHGGASNRWCICNSNFFNLAKSFFYPTFFHQRSGFVCWKFWPSKTWYVCCWKKTRVHKTQPSKYGGCWMGS